MFSGPRAGGGIPNGAMQSNSAMSLGQVIEDGFDSLCILRICYEYGATFLPEVLGC